jgi:hypothetical protein
MAVRSINVNELVAYNVAITDPARKMSNLD